MKTIKLTIYFLTILLALTLSMVSNAFAATEFTSIIDPDNGTGTDYTSLNAWEAANQVDLTATSTLVFSHSGITGTIPDGSTVTGATSGIIGETTHVTSTQILIQNIRTSLTGTLTFTNGSTAVSGTGTLFTTEISAGDYIWLDADSTWAEVSSITDDSNLVLSVAYTGTGGTGTGAVRKGNFTSGEQVYETLDTNYVTISDAGDSAIAVASCRSSNGTADTTAVTIDGWTTSSSNYIKVYTTQANRHDGTTTGSSYYEMKSTAHWQTMIDNEENYTHIEGVVIDLDNYASTGIVAGGGTDDITYVDSCIIFNSTSSYSTGFGESGNGYCIFKVTNSLVYNVAGSGFYQHSFRPQYFYNNIITNCGTGFDGRAYASAILKNNIAYNNTTDYSGTFDASSDYNISSDDTAPGANSKINQTVNFISTTSGIEDFHLAQSDTSARDAGTDLSADANLAFSTDIDGTTRTGSWDIGADEGSVEFTPTVMESGGDYSSLSAWEAGVQTDLTASTTRVFSHSGITGTISDNSTVTGATSGATATVVHATNTQILLENISATFQSGEQVYETLDTNYIILSDNGNPAIAVAKIDGTWTNPDTTPVTIDGWTTDHDNYIKIYTTDTARHRGVAGTGYYLQTTGQFRVYEDYVRIDGVELYQANNNTLGIYFLSSGETNSDIRVSNCLIHGFTYAIYGLNVATHKIWNNIIYNNTNYGIELGATGSANYIYNNTIFGGTRGIDCTSGTRYIYNNIVQNTSGVAYNIGIGGITGNNISSDATSPDGASFQNLIVPFISTISSSEDFHLASYDTVAKDAGTNLSTDSYLPFSTDIDGNSRPIGSGWDIGADEYNATESVKMRGSVKLRGHFKFR